MSQNFRQPGRTLTVAVTDPAGVVSGALVVVGALIGVAATSGEMGEEVSVDVEGVFELPKVTADDASIGELLYVSGAGFNGITLTVDGTGSKLLAGMATRTAAAGTSLVECKLGGGLGLTGPA